MFRLGLLNPNTDLRYTTAMRDVALAALPDGCEVSAASPERGPCSIESEVDSVVAAAEVVALMRALPDQDAYLIACFGDPGLEAARELTEAAYQAAMMVGKRFAVITTLSRGIPAIEDSLDRQGVGSRCVGVVPLGIAVAEQGAGYPATTEAIIEAGRRAVAERSADSLVLACGSMADVADVVSEAVAVPVCEGVSFGAMLAFSLWSCGLRTSKAGAYGWPEPIDYVGMPGFGG